MFNTRFLALALQAPLLRALGAVCLVSHQTLHVWFKDLGLEQALV